MRILLVSQMYRGPTDPDVFVRGLDEQLVARGHEVERAVLDRRGGSKVKYIRTRTRDARLFAPLQARMSVLREPAERWRGGYSRVSLDSDGHSWEVAYNPGMPLGPDGSQTVGD